MDAPRCRPCWEPHIFPERYKLSHGRELRCDIEYQTRIESWKECNNDDDNDGYDLGKGGPRINHLLYILDLKLFERTDKQLGTLINTVHIYGEETRIGCGVCKCGILIVQKGKLVD